MSKLWRRRLLILLGLLVAYALRVYKLGDQNIWWDEGLSVLAARKSFAGATLWTAADVHPPLYFWLLWAGARLAGETEFALRYVTVIESLLTVAVMFPLGRRLSRKPLVGIGALWLLGLSRFHVWWSQEMRMYILASLCSMLSLYFVTRLTAERPSRRDRVGWILATAGALYTIYSSVVLLVIENLFMLVVGLKRRERRKFWGHWLLSQLVVALGVLPWLMLALPRMRSWSVVQEPASLRFVLELDAVLLSLGISTDVGHYALPAALVMASVALGVFLLLRQRQGQAPEEGASDQSLLLLGLSVLLPPLVIWVLTQPRAIFYTPRVEARYLLPFAPAFYLLLAWSLAGWLRSRALRPVGIAIGISLLGLAAWSLPQHYAPRYLRDDFQTLTRQIWAYARPGDAVVLVSGNRYPLFDSYYDRTPAPPDRPPVYRIPDGQPALTSTVADEILKDIAAGHERIWLAQVERHLQDPEGYTEDWLAEHYARPLSCDFGYNNLSLFTTQDKEPTVPTWNLPPQHEVRQTLAPGTTLLGYDLLTREFRPLDTLRLGLYLRVERPTTLTIKLLGEDGRQLDEATLPLVSGEGVIRREAAFVIRPYTPPQRYHFELQAGDGMSLSLGEARVTHTAQAPDVDKIQHPLQARVGDTIRLWGYRLGGVKRGQPPLAHPGDTLTLDLYWETGAPVAQSYHVFTHLLGTAYNPATQGPLWAQDDQLPLDGDYPTDRWLPGIPLEDHYVLHIAPDAPPGDYQLTVGMYTLENGERLPVSGDGANVAAGYILLTPLQIMP